jgi:hypothetical protein
VIVADAVVASMITSVELIAATLTFLVHSPASLSCGAAALVTVVHAWVGAICDAALGPAAFAVSELSLVIAAYVVSALASVRAVTAVASAMFPTAALAALLTKPDAAFATSEVAVPVHDLLGI